MLAKHGVGVFGEVGLRGGEVRVWCKRDQGGWPLPKAGLWYLRVELPGCVPGGCGWRTYGGMVLEGSLERFVSVVRTAWQESVGTFPCDATEEDDAACGEDAGGEEYLELGVDTVFVPSAAPCEPCARYIALVEEGGRMALGGGGETWMC